MRKITTICLLLLWATLGMAQGTRFGLTAGFVASKPSDYKMHPGFQIGGKAELLFTKNIPNLYLAPSLLFTSKGWKDEVYDESMDKNLDWKCDAYYLELPVLLGFKVPLRNDYKVVMEFGPYLAYGLFGKSEIEGARQEYKIDNVFSSVYKRFDFGFKALVGLDIKHWQVGIGYSGSLQKPTRNDWAGISPKDISYYLQVSYFL